MLPNHAPYVIAEQFGTLARLFPGRIDLGLGRAPGTDQLTLHALRRPPEAAETFPQDVLELQAFLAPAGPEPAHPGGSGGRNGGAALDPRIEPFRRDAGRRARAALRFRVAFRARPSDFRAADLPRAVQAVGATRPALRDGRRQHHRRRNRRQGAAARHDSADVVRQHLPRRAGLEPAADRRHRELLDANGEGAGDADAGALDRRLAGYGPQGHRCVGRGNRRRRTHRRLRRLRAFRATALLRADR